MTKWSTYTQFTDLLQAPITKQEKVTTLFNTSLSTLKKHSSPNQAYLMNTFFVRSQTYFFQVFP